MGLIGRNTTQDFARGILPDLENDELPVLRDAENVHFPAGHIKPAQGQRLMVNTGQNLSILAVHSQNAYGTDRLFFAMANGIYEYSAAGLNRRYEGAVTFCQFSSFGNFTLAAFGRVLHYCDNNDEGSSAPQFKPMPGAPEADFVTVNSTHIITYKGRQSHWAAQDDPFTWEPTLDNTARRLPIRDMDSDIMAVQDWQGGVAILSEDGLWLQRYIGTPYIFGITKIMGGLGVLGREALCSVGTMLYGISGNGVWSTDGAQRNILDTPGWRKKFFAQEMNASKTDLTVAWHDSANERVLFFYHKKDGAIRAFVYSYKYQNLTLIKQGFTAVDRSGVYGKQVLGSVGGQIFSQTSQTVAVSQIVPKGLQIRKRVTISYGYGQYPYGAAPYGGFVLENPKKSTSAAALEITYNYNGQDDFFTPLIPGIDNTAYVVSRPLDFGSDEDKYIDDVEFKIRDVGRSQLMFSYSAKQYIDDDEQWSVPVSLADTKGRAIIREQARYISWRIEDPFVVADWAITEVSFFGTLVGGRR